MNCPEHLVLRWFGGRFYVWMYWRDVPRSMIPLRIWLDPLRYELFFRAFGRTLTINREGLYIRSCIWRAKRALRCLIGAGND